MGVPKPGKKAAASRHLPPEKNLDTVVVTIQSFAFWTDNILDEIITVQKPRCFLSLYKVFGKCFASAEIKLSSLNVPTSQKKRLRNLSNISIAESVTENPTARKIRTIKANK